MEKYFIFDYILFSEIITYEIASGLTDRVKRNIKLKNGVQYSSIIP